MKTNIIKSLNNTFLYLAVASVVAMLVLLSGAGITTATESPSVPECAFEAGENTTIVNFADHWLSSKVSLEYPSDGPVSVSLSSGTYEVSLMAWDGYAGRVNTSQPNESFFVKLEFDGGYVVNSDSTSDLDDNVTTATVTETVNEELVVESAVNEVTAYHAVYPDDSSANSVYPVCAAFTLIEEPEPTLGSIEICKVVIDAEGNIVDGYENDGTFSITGVDMDDATGILGDTIFSTPLSYNSNLFGDDETDDAECVTYGELDLGGYYYSEEEIDGDNWFAPLYNDQNITDVSSFDDFYSYSGELFTPSEDDDEDRNTDSDGHIVLTEDRKDRTLVILNQYEIPDTPYSPYCGDGETNQEWEQCDGGESCTEQCLFDNQCTEIALARVNVDDTENWGTGSVTSDIYLGSLTNKIPAGVWFLLNLDDVYETDGDMVSEGYEDVPGLAVERSEGSIRLGLYGSMNQTEGPNKEHVDGNIEFWGADVLAQSSDDSENNKLENGFNGLSSYSAGEDEVWLVDENTTQSFFWLTVTVADDTFFTTYEDVQVCEDENETVNIVATKISCTEEEDLPNWGAGGPDISESTASDFLAEENSCSLEEDWYFEWAQDGVSNPGDNTGIAGGDWTTFGPTDSNGVAETILTEEDLDETSKIWVREVFQDGYIPFTHSGETSADLEILKSCFGQATPSGTICDDADFNADGIVNFADLALFKSASVYDFVPTYEIVDLTNPDTFDLTFMNNCMLAYEYVPVHMFPSTCDEADLNGDGAIDILDLALADFNSTINDLTFMNNCMLAYEYVPVQIFPSTCDEADLNGDGAIDILDLIEFNSAAKYDLNGDNLVDLRESGSSKSAEMYCHTNVLNYDNYDFITSPVLDETYYCVAFNVPEVIEYPQCSDGIDNDDDQLVDALDPGCHTDGDPGNPYSYDPEDDDETDPVTYQCSDDIDNDGDELADELDPGCWIDEEDPYSYDPNDDNENEKPVITLLGDNPLIIELLSTYTDEGAEADDPEDGDITDDIVVGGDVIDTSSIGDYFVTYDVDDSEGLSADTATRTVTVIDPSEPKQCSDEVDNDGDETTDSEDAGCHTDGNPENPESYNPNDDDENEKPVITRIGDETIEITKGDSYTDEGAEADDPEDGDITEDIVVGGDTVDTNSAGTYVITYNVEDGDGLAADEVTRTIKVKNPTVTPSCTVNCGGGGGGGGPILVSLKIFDEQITVVSEGAALITWKTNFPASSRVVYGAESQNINAGNINLGGEDPNLNYATSTGTDTELKTVHSMLVTSVDLSSLYFFRPISDTTSRAVGIELNANLDEVVIEQCSQYLLEFIQLGADNNVTEVEKLQTFLRDFEGFTELQVTGVYDQATYDAVVAFQTKYGSDILSPWGLQQDTGYVYLTTRKKINEIYCNFQQDFPLSSSQQQEVDAFKALLESLEAQGLPLPETSTVGVVTPAQPTLVVEPPATIVVEEAGTEESTTEEEEEDDSSLAAAIEAGEVSAIGGFFRGIGNFFRGLFR